MAPRNMPASLSGTLQIILEQRKLGTGLYDAASSRTQIVQICQAFIGNPINDFVKAPRGRGVDVWLQKEGVDYLFDTKTVQSNVSGFVEYMEQVLTWYAYYYSKYPSGNAQARIVFPYNPEKSEFWSCVKGGGFPLEPHNEAWVENEFWDFCSGLTDTFSLIRQAFSDLRESKELERELEVIFSIQNELPTPKGISFLKIVDPEEEGWDDPSVE